MKVFSKLLFVCIICMLVLGCFEISFATEEVNNDSVVTLDENATLVDSGNSGDDATYLDSINDYNAIVGEVNDEEEDPLKQYYDQYQEYLKTYYDTYERPVTYRAKILEVGEAKDSYYQQDYYSVSKYVVQRIKVKILEGEYKDKEYEFDYILTMDSLNNIHLAKAKVGSVIYVNLSDDGTGALKADVPNSWSTTERFPVVIWLAVIAGLLLLIYAGKKGFSAILVCLAVILGTVVVIPYFAFNSMNVVLAAVGLMLLIILGISAIHLGLHKAMFKAALISTCMVLISWFVLYLACTATSTVGITFEFAAIAENVIQGNINFEQLYYIISLYMSAGIIANTIAMSVNRMQKENVDSFGDRLEVSRTPLATNIIILTIVVFALYIPNHLLLLTNKFLEKEVLNSETFISELVRYFTIVIMATLSLPVASLNIFGFGKKFLESPKKEEQVVEEKTQEEAEEKVEEKQ